jgi:hypothetical protein
VYQKTMDREEIQAAGALDRIFFGHFFFPSDFRYPNAESHYRVNEMLNGVDPFNAVMCHRHWAKSTFLAVIDNVHQICYNKNLDHRFNVIIQETQGQAQNSLIRVSSALEFNTRIKQVFGDFKTGGRKWGAKEIVTNNNVRVTAMGTGQRVRSLIEVGGRRPTRTVIDDFESESNGNTPEARRENLKWLYAAVLPFRDKDIGQIFLTQTPISNDCCIWKIMDDPSWNTIKVPIYSIDPETGKVILAWPEAWGWERIMQERKAYDSQGLRGLFDQEYMLIPYKGEQVGIDAKDIRYFSGELKVNQMGIKYIEGLCEVSEDGSEELSTKRNVAVNTFSSCDPALGTDRQHDRTAIGTIAMDKDENVYLLNEDSFRSGSSFYIGNTFAEFAYMGKSNGIGVETVAFQSAIGEICDKWCSDHNISFDFVRGFNPRTAKDVRLNWLCNRFKSRKVFLRPSQTRPKAELLAWPSGGHDDYLDMLYMAVKIAYGPGYDDPSKAAEDTSSYLAALRKIPSARVA